MRTIVLWLALALVVGVRAVHVTAAGAVRWILDELEAAIRRALEPPDPPAEYPWEGRRT